MAKGDVTQCIIDHRTELQGDGRECERITVEPEDTKQSSTKRAQIDQRAAPPLGAEHARTLPLWPYEEAVRAERQQVADGVFKGKRQRVAQKDSSKGRH